MPEFGTQAIKIRVDDPKTYVWRNKESDSYKIAQGFKDVPLELSNYLLVRTREHLLLQNKVQNKFMSGSVLSKFTKDYNEKALDEVRQSLDAGLQDFQKVFYVENEDFDQPVAFATNTLYILTRNNLLAASGNLIEEHLLPLIKKK